MGSRFYSCSILFTFLMVDLLSIHLGLGSRTHRDNNSVLIAEAFFLSCSTINLSKSVL